MTGQEARRDTAEFASVRRGVAELLGQLPGAPSALRVRAGDITIEVEWSGSGDAGPDAAGTTATSPTDSPASELHHIRAPTIGAFYRAPVPGEPPFVSEGDLVTPGQQVGILEAMKIMIPVEADCHGRVTQVLRDDAAQVEYGDPLLAVEPVAA